MNEGSQTNLATCDLFPVGDDVLHIHTHFKPTETFQYTHFSFCNPHRVRKGLIKGESLGLLRTNSSAKSFYENIYNFKKRLRTEGKLL